MLSVDAISARSMAARGCCDDVSFDVEDGQIVSVVGANGAGKSTLVKVISGMVRPTAGQIIFGGEDITALPVHEIVGRGIVHVPEGRRLFGDMTVLENLLAWLDASPGARGARAEGWIGSTRLFPILARAARAARRHALGWPAADGRDRAGVDVVAEAADARRAFARARPEGRDRDSRRHQAPERATG